MKDFCSTLRFGEDLDKDVLCPWMSRGWEQPDLDLPLHYQFLHGSSYSCCLWGPFAYLNTNKLEENEGIPYFYMFSDQGSAYKESGFPGRGCTSSHVAPPKSQISQGCQIYYNICLGTGIETSTWEFWPFSICFWSSGNEDTHQCLQPGWCAAPWMSNCASASLQCRLSQPWRGKTGFIFVENTWNHGIFWVGRDLQGSL